MSIEESLAEKAAALTSRSQQRRASRTPKWEPSSLDDLASGRVLAFDQTFSKTGWVMVEVRDGALTIHAKGFINEPPIPDNAKFEDILQRSEWMYDRICLAIAEVLGHMFDFDVVHEAPILHGLRVESSLLGALAVRLACVRLLSRRPSIVENRRMLAILLPPGERMNQVGKGHITRGLLPFLDTRKGWNEHTRDGLALAITYLYDKKRAAL